MFDQRSIRVSRCLALAPLAFAIACQGPTGSPNTTASGGSSGAAGTVGGDGGSRGGAQAGTGGATATAGTGGTTATGGAGGTTVDGGADGGAVGSGGASGAGSGGRAGNSTGGAPATGGAAGVGPADGGIAGDIPPSRPMNITAARARYEHTFRTRDADATVTFNDNTQIAIVDNRAATMMGKLVLPFAGAGTRAGTLGASGTFCSRRGFHVLAIAAFQDYDIVLGDADFYGDARRQVFEGVTRTRVGEFANITMTPADGVAQRTEKALQYLHAMYPAEDWGYYLTADGQVRWSDVVFTGMSHGASNAARFAMLVRASRAVSISGPRDNMCTSLNASNCGGVVATWFSEVPKTPIDRFYALTGVSDEQHTQHLFAMQALTYLGTAVTVNGMQAPYGGSHRLRANGGHVDYCGETAYRDACNYMYGVPAENQNGTQ